MTSDLPKPALKTKTFRIPLSLGVQLLVPCALFAGLAVLASTRNLLVSSSESPLLAVLVIPGALGLIWLSYRYVRSLQYQVVVNAEGVLYVPLTGPSEFLAWHEITRIVADDTWQRLILYGATNNRRIRVDYQLEDFARLRDLVLAHAAVTVSPLAEVGQTFHRTWINKVILLGFAALSLFFAYIAFVGGELVVSLGLGGLTAPLLWAFFFVDPTHVVIARDGLVIQYLCRRQLIPWKTISAISLKDIRDASNGNVWAAVVIERQHGRPVRLFRFREGSLALRDALQAAWLTRSARAEPDRASDLTARGTRQ